MLIRSNGYNSQLPALLKSSSFPTTVSARSYAVRPTNSHKGNSSFCTAFLSSLPRSHKFVYRNVHSFVPQAGLSNVRLWDFSSSRNAEDCSFGGLRSKFSCGPISHTRRDPFRQLRSCRADPDVAIVIDSGDQQLVNRTPAARFEPSHSEKAEDREGRSLRVEQAKIIDGAVGSDKHLS